MATWIIANAVTYADILTRARQFLTGLISLEEFLIAILASLSVRDFVALIGVGGLSAYATFQVVMCNENG